MYNRSERVALVIDSPLWLMGNWKRLRGEVDPNMHLLGEPLNTHPAFSSHHAGQTMIKVAYASHQSGEDSGIGSCLSAKLVIARWPASASRRQVLVTVGSRGM